MPDATIKEVARHAGVSPSTVSYVLSGHRSISEATRARVQLAIQELDYKPNAGARSLRAGKTGVIALADPLDDWSSAGAQQPYVYGHMPYVYGVVDAARRRGWNVMLISRGGGSAGIEEVVRSKMVDGVVLTEVTANDERLRLLGRLSVPTVALGMPLDETSVRFVDFDFDAAGRLCVEHLVAQGHRHIGFLASPPATFERGLSYAVRLWRSVRAALEARGLVFHGRPSDTTTEGTNAALDALFGDEPALSGLIINCEGTADLLMQTLKERGKRVPLDLSVVFIGWGGLIKQITPPLAHVDVPALEMGRSVVEVLAKNGPSRLLPAAFASGSTLAPPWHHT